MDKKRPRIAPGPWALQVGASGRGAVRAPRVLRLTTQLVTDFLAEPDPTQKAGPVVVRIGGNKVQS
jgi:hypothetical protein